MTIVEHVYIDFHMNIESTKLIPQSFVLFFTQTMDTYPIWYLDVSLAMMLT